MLTAIFGGTFNPFHNGHFEMLKSLNEDPRIEEIFLLPDKIPPHKSADALIDDETRISMCRIIAEKFEKCRLCLIEFEREGRSYTYDTVNLLKAKFPSKKFAFVCGGDMLVYFDRWWNYKELMKMLPFIVFSRVNTNENEFLECINRFRSEGMKIILKEDKIPDISSTQIRSSFSQSESLLPKEVFEFLKERGVYDA